MFSSITLERGKSTTKVLSHYWRCSEQDSNLEPSKEKPVALLSQLPRQNGLSSDKPGKIKKNLLAQTWMQKFKA